MPRPLLVAAVGVTLLLVTLTSLNVGLIVNGASAVTVYLSLAVSLLVLLVAIWALYVLLYTRLFRPLRILEEQLRMLTLANTEHRLQIPSEHLLGSLPRVAEELGEALTRERHQTARAIDSATTRIERRKARLEAILHDLTEGIVVCSVDHRIVLFNQAAGSRLGQVGPFGLHRDIQKFFPGEQLTEHFSQLSDRFQKSGFRGVAQFDSEPPGDHGNIPLRMTLIIDTNRRCNGYVLSFPGNSEHDGNGGGVEHSVLLERPLFYDFSPFDREPPAEFGERPLDELTFVVFDTETTGLHPSTGDEIVQLSGIRIVNGSVAEEEFDCLVNPGKPIPAASTRFHGITDDMVVNAPDVKTAVRSFHAFAGDAVLVAHNAAFDMKFLKLKEQESKVYFDQPVLDTLLLSFVLQPSHNSHTLDAIASRYGVDLRPDVRHTALGDARCTGQIFLQMLHALPHHGISTLDQALLASSRVFDVRKLQEQF